MGWQQQRKATMSGSDIPAAAIPAVEVLSAEKTYPGGTQALLPVDLRIEEGSS